MAPMDVAVTGSSGLIGPALADRLAGSGHRVLRVVRGTPSGSGQIGWDPEAGRIDAGGLEGLGAVVHLAGAPIARGRWTANSKRRILASRTIGTTLLAQTLAGLDRPPAALLSGSAIGYYGDRGDEELTEDSPPGSGFLAEVVRAWEGAAGAAIEAGIRTAFLRTGIVLAAHGGALRRTLPLFRLGLGGRLGSGRQWWSWISLPDEVGAIEHLLTADVAGPVNLTGPAPVTNRRFTDALGEVLHRPTVLPVPAFGPRLVLGRQLADEVVFWSQRVLPRRLETSGYAFRHPTVDVALRAVLA
jgi:uncharacterized protein (TIGR01777 family)